MLITPLCAYVFYFQNKMKLTYVTQKLTPIIEGLNYASGAEIQLLVFTNIPGNVLSF